MSARTATAACLLLAACAPIKPAFTLPSATPHDTFVAHCQGKTGWNDAAPPVKVFGNVYYVGTCGITSLLIASNEGHILVDGGTIEAAPLIAANVEALGFELNDVEWIVTSHEHHDHVGGVAELKRLTGARLAASEAAKRTLETGILDPSDPQAGLHEPFAAIRVDRVMRDGEVLTLGLLSLTMHETPGHSPGSTSWSWETSEELYPGEPLTADFVYADSVTAVSTDRYRFSDHPEYVAAFRRSLDKIGGIGFCSVVVTPHPAASGLFEYFARERPVANSNSCRRYAEQGRANLEARLAREAVEQ